MVFFLPVLFKLPLGYRSLLCWSKDRDSSLFSILEGFLLLQGPWGLKLKFVWGSSLWICWEGKTMRRTHSCPSVPCYCESSQGLCFYPRKKWGISTKRLVASFLPQSEYKILQEGNRDDTDFILRMVCLHPSLQDIAGCWGSIFFFLWWNIIPKKQVWHSDILAFRIPFTSVGWLYDSWANYVHVNIHLLLYVVS